MECDEEKKGFSFVKFKFVCMCLSVSFIWYVSFNCVLSFICIVDNGVNGLVGVILSFIGL